MVISLAWIKIDRCKANRTLFCSLFWLKTIDANLVLVMAWEPALRYEEKRSNLPLKIREQNLGEESIFTINNIDAGTKYYEKLIAMSLKKLLS